MSNPTVCLTFDFDAISVWIGSFGLSSPTYVSRGEFAANVATPRILKLLEREGLRSTWYIPGLDADTYPDVCRRIRDAGHEIGHHGYAHEGPVNLDEAEERRVLERGLDTLDRVLEARSDGRSDALGRPAHQRGFAGRIETRFRLTPSPRWLRRLLRKPRIAVRKGFGGLLRVSDLDH